MFSTRSAASDVRGRVQPALQQQAHRGTLSRRTNLLGRRPVSVFCGLLCLLTWTGLWKSSSSLWGTILPIRKSDSGGGTWIHSVESFLACWMICLVHGENPALWTLAIYSSFPGNLAYQILFHSFLKAYPHKVLQNLQWPPVMCLVLLCFWLTVCLEFRVDICSLATHCASF